MALGSTQPLKEMSTRNIWAEGGYSSTVQRMLYVYLYHKLCICYYEQV